MTSKASRSRRRSRGRFQKTGAKSRRTAGCSTTRREPLARWSRRRSSINAGCISRARRQRRRERRGALCASTAEARQCGSPYERHATFRKAPVIGRLLLCGPARLHPRRAGRVLVILGVLAAMAVPRFSTCCPTRSAATRKSRSGAALLARTSPSPAAAPSASPWIYTATRAPARRRERRPCRPLRARGRVGHRGDHARTDRRSRERRRRDVNVAAGVADRIRRAGQRRGRRARTIVVGPARSRSPPAAWWPCHELLVAACVA